jgi:hypothetical protein
MDLRGFNLNLLIVFEVLLTERSVGNAASGLAPGPLPLNALSERGFKGSIYGQHALIVSVASAPQPIRLDV